MNKFHIFYPFYIKEEDIDLKAKRRQGFPLFGSFMRSARIDFLRATEI